MERLTAATDLALEAAREAKGDALDASEVEHVLALVAWLIGLLAHGLTPHEVAATLHGEAAETTTIH